MPKIDARLPKGMRDFLPGEVLKREYVIDVITDVFQTFGFEPIYTPTLEMLRRCSARWRGRRQAAFTRSTPAARAAWPALRPYRAAGPLRVCTSTTDHALPPLPHRSGVARRLRRRPYREFFQCDVAHRRRGDMAADAGSSAC